MNTPNPFVPNVALITVPDRSRGRRLKVALYALAATPVLFFAVQWVQDWRSARPTRADTPSPDLSTPGATPVRALEKKPQTASTWHPNTAPTQSSPSLARESAAQGATHSPLFHVVKSGDTLFDISRTYSTTVRAIKAANGLSSERLAVGTRLRIPEPATVETSTMEN